MAILHRTGTLRSKASNSPRGKNHRHITTFSRSHVYCHLSPWGQRTSENKEVGYEKYPFKSNRTQTHQDICYACTVVGLIRCRCECSTGAFESSLAPDHWKFGEERWSHLLCILVERSLARVVNFRLGILISQSESLEMAQLMCACMYYLGIKSLFGWALNHFTA